ncbi:hypothetical protein [Halococcus saccharolyticus]|uniref:Uncharacterized protein n=1 Tax=Halococcus saccharolyticus DSM 5350 TaxID=1227455 RepID=M0MA92_9EURY|nr:hypothetical protein [Halococcus saccharolyticus]EMA42712.1 hypothetical protein C449_16258 [Halococcus saccharolyticus DSM 5350]
MATEEAETDGRYLTRQNVMRCYRWLTGLAIGAVVTVVVAEGFVPRVVTGTAIGCWLLASLLLFAHVGIKNTTHGV